MKSLKELYRIGKGPSSSHTIGPERACKIFLAENPGAESFKAVLYGSLAKTGVGHGTDGVVKSVLKNVEIECDDGSDGLPHPNTMDLFAYNGGRETASMRVYSVGGGNPPFLRGKSAAAVRLCFRMRRRGAEGISQRGMAGDESLR